MAIRQRLLDLEQRLRRLAGEAPPREPLEVRQAVLQAIVDLAQPAGGGRRVFPFDRVEVEVLAEAEEARRVLEAVLAREEGVEAAVRQALAAVGCALSRPLPVRVTYRRRVPVGWAEGQRFAVRGRAQGEPDAAAGAEPAATGGAAAAPRLVLRVVKGRATRRAVDVATERLNLGRGDEVLDREQRLVRRNHVAFVGGEPASDSVSRAHAHIRRAASGECRLRDDGSAHGTRIVREGRTIDVTPGNARGVRLQPGDEVHLGRAVLRVDGAKGETPTA
jgi:hypothetical protein